MKKTVDFFDLCRYDKGLRYAVDVKVLSNDFLLGDKGDQLRFVVSEYGYNRLLTDSLEEEISSRLEEGAERLGLLFPKKGESNE